MKKTKKAELSSGEEIVRDIMHCADLVHARTGPGLLDTVYNHFLGHELEKLGYEVDLQVPVPLNYRGVFMSVGFRADMIVENQILVEVKSVDQLKPLHFSQTKSYLKLSKLKKGLLMNFNSSSVLENTHRVANELVPVA